MSWSEVDWLEVAGCLVIAVPVLVVGVRHRLAGRRELGERALWWGLGMLVLAGAAVLESLIGAATAIGGIAVAVVCFGLAVAADRKLRRSGRDQA